jgi:hypothetical protein
MSSRGVPGSLVGKDSMYEFADYLPRTLPLVAGAIRPTVAFTIVFSLASIGTLLNVRDWYDGRQRQMAECPHRWIYGSAWHEGRYWHRVCRDCPKQERVEPGDVPEEWRQRDRAAHRERMSARRGGGPVCLGGRGGSRVVLARVRAKARRGRNRSGRR